jgi:hypothetical protein
MHNVSVSEIHAVGSDPASSSDGQRTAPRRNTAGRMKRAGGYGSLAVSAWLLTAVATGHGVAAADDSPSSSSSATSSSETRSTPDSDSGSTTSSSSGSGTPASAADAAESASERDEESDTPGAATESSVSDPEEARDGDETEDEATSDDTDAPDVPEESSAPVAPEATEDPETPEAEEAELPTSSEDSAPHAGPVSSGSSGGSDRSSTRDDRVESTPAKPVSSIVTARPKLTDDSVGAESKELGVTTSSDTAPTAAVQSAVTPNAMTAVQQSTPATVRNLPRPIEMITSAVNAVVSAIFSPLMTSLPEAPAGQNPFAWAVLAFVRRNFFNQAPTITSINIGKQQADGTISGYIDAVDPDELGKTVDITANVYAAPAQPRVPEPGCECATIDGFQGLPFTNAASLGTAPGSTWSAPDAVDNTCVYIGADGRVTYTGTETGEVTIAGLGTGDVTLVFEGLLLSATEERSVAQLQSHLGTGDLKGVKGTVISQSTLDATGAATGVLTGEVVRPELRYKIVKQAAHGTVVLDEISGQFTYTPDSAFADQGGDDSFQIVVTDNRLNLSKLFDRYNGDPVKTVNLSVAGSAAAANTQV